MIHSVIKRRSSEIIGWEIGPSNSKTLVQVELDNDHHVPARWKMIEHFAISGGSLFMVKVLFALLLLPFFYSPVQASYCWFSGGRLTDGQTVTVALRVVVASVERVHIPGKSDQRPWCIQHRRSLGGHSSNRIIESPKLGQVRANGYRISYRGDRVGQDRFTIERRWLNPSTNGWFTGRIVYEVQVVAQPF